VPCSSTSAAPTAPLRRAWCNVGRTSASTVADVSDAPLRARQLHGCAAVSLEPDEERLPFETGAYDVVLSNSVIEHVTLPRDECLRGVGSEAEWLRRLIRFTDRWWIKRCDVVDWHLLDIAAMRQLFPDATLRVERALGLPKSILAWRAAAWSGH
jgi:hypothetical protein